MSPAAPKKSAFDDLFGDMELDDADVLASIAPASDPSEPVLIEGHGDTDDAPSRQVSFRELFGDAVAPVASFELPEMPLNLPEQPFELPEMPEELSDENWVPEIPHLDDARHFVENLDRSLFEPVAAAPAAVLDFDEETDPGPETVESEDDEEEKDEDDDSDEDVGEDEDLEDEDDEEEEIPSAPSSLIDVAPALTKVVEVVDDLKETAAAEAKRLRDRVASLEARLEERDNVAATVAVMPLLAELEPVPDDSDDEDDEPDEDDDVDEDDLDDVAAEIEAVGDDAVTDDDGAETDEAGWTEILGEPEPEQDDSLAMFDGTILGELMEHSPAFRQYAETRAANSRPAVRKAHPARQSRDWTIDFGPASAPAGQILRLTVRPQVVFRGDKIIATDSADPPGTGTRISTITVGQKVQRPASGSSLTAFFSSNALGNGIRWDVDDPALTVAVTVSFLQAVTFNMSVFGRAILVFAMLLGLQNAVSAAYSVESTHVARVDDRLRSGLRAGGADSRAHGLAAGGVPRREGDRDRLRHAGRLRHAHLDHLGWAAAAATGGRRHAHGLLLADRARQRDPLGPLGQGADARADGDLRAELHVRLLGLRQVHSVIAKGVA